MGRERGTRRERERGYNGRENEREREREREREEVIYREWVIERERGGES